MVQLQQSLSRLRPRIAATAHRSPGTGLFDGQYANEYTQGMPDVQPNELKRLFKSRLKELRTLRAMSQATLAEKIGAQQPYIAALESGERSPTLETIAKLSEALDVAPDALLGCEKIPA